MYARGDAVGWEQSCAFRNTFSITVKVDFLGVWYFFFIQISVFPLLLIVSSILRDTVNSVGLFPHRLPLTMANSSIRFYRHAVSLDERRAKFKANLSPRTGGAGKAPQRQREKPQKRPTLWELEKKWNDPNAPTDVLEVWFSGKWTSSQTL